jgi:hypothetical protein
VALSNAFQQQITRLSEMVLGLCIAFRCICDRAMVGEVFQPLVAEQEGRRS